MLTLSSSAFRHNSRIPMRFTADGENVSPPLEWTGVPRATRSFAVIVEDPDAPDPRAPQGTWVHWVVYDIPAETRALAEGEALPAGAFEGLNDWRQLGYGGPSPPTGEHRYVHRLFALDTMLADLHHPNKAQLIYAMKGHVLAEARLIGMYERTH